MEKFWEGHVVGEFLGYGNGRIYQLSDGSRWQQQGLTDEPAYRNAPKARLLRKSATDARFLDVEGTSGIVQVQPL